jgi:hypothetical protein
MKAEGHFFAVIHDEGAWDGTGNKWLTRKASLQNPYEEQIMTQSDFTSELP